VDKIRVLLVDDHTLVRAGIRSLLEKIEEVEVVAEAGDGLTALGLIRTHRPGVVLMDIAMSELNGLETTERISKEFPATRVIILSMHANEEYVLQALRSGIAGYLLKDAAAVELELAIKAVVKGETYLSPAISRNVIEQYLARLKGGQTSTENLTPRQREILQLIAEGKNTKEIAFVLGLSTKTVETHRSLMMERLDIRDIAGLVRYAMRIGLVKGERGIS
jgi:DNA-binding NarL/FixJ family response regulator